MSASGASNEPIIIVSGLPRSGTSLIMQMLQAGGVPVLTDGVRAADVSNPRGYFEYEKVKWLAADNAWLGEARGKALKVIAQLVPFLPIGYPYRVLFMQRELAEVLRSQKTMIETLGKTGAGDDEALAVAFERSVAAAREFIEHQPNAAAITVRYRELMADPVQGVERIVQFLGRPNLDRQAMIGAIDASLYRARSG